ncbi:MAG: hypothetical protein EOM05_11520, partial [Clostridia bacterium]|nr:hypothetical protein [Clostridia bacterium]
MKTLKNAILPLLLTFIFVNSNAQQTFEKAYFVEGEVSSYINYLPYFVKQNSEGDYYFGGHKSLTAESSCTFISKVNSSGIPIWSKNINQPGARDIIETSDGGFLITSSSYGYNSNMEILLIKTNALFDTIWTQRIGSQDIYDNTLSKGYTTKEIDNSYYLTLGATSSYGVGPFDIIISKTDIEGNNIWCKTIGSISNESAIDFVQTIDNGFVICGTSNHNTDAGFNVCLVKIDSLGNLIWSKTYNGYLEGQPKKIKVTKNNGFLVMGNYTRLDDNRDIYIFETDSLGNLLWAKTYGSELVDNAWDILSLSEGGYVFTGSTQDLTNLDDDVLAVKLTTSGDTVWTKQYGDQMSNYGNVLCKTKDNGYMIAGVTTTDFGEGEHQYSFLVKTDYNGNTGCSNFSNIFVDDMTFIETTQSFQVLNGGYFRHLSECEIEDVNLTDTLLCSFAQNVESYNTSSTISCYPNPFYESTEIFLKNSIPSCYTVSMFNVTGEIVRKFEISNSNSFSFS